MDNEIRKLLKDSILKVSSEDFTDQVMKKIYEEMHDGAQIKRNIQWACFFTCLSFLLLPIVLTFSQNLFSIYESYITQFIQSLEEVNVIELTIALAMTLILLFQLDNLIRLIIDYNKSKSMVDVLKS